MPWARCTAATGTGAARMDEGERAPAKAKLERIHAHVCIMLLRSREGAHQDSAYSGDTDTMGDIRSTVSRMDIRRAVSGMYVPRPLLCLLDIKRSL